MWQTVRRRLLGDDERATRRARHTNLQLKLPNPHGGPAWVTATLALSSTPVARGETLRIRAHLDSCFQSPSQAGDRSALGHGADESRAGLGALGRTLAASAARQAVAVMPRGLRQRLAEQRRRSWLDMQISTAPLDAGAAALMPEALRERYGDRLPRAMPGAPRVGVWAGPAGGPLGGLARLAMVQFDDSDLGPAADHRAGDRFCLNLTIGELVEPASLSGDPEH